MTIGWLAVLRSVPWDQVITNAPKVVDSAKKLWRMVAKKPAPQKIFTSSMQPHAPPEPKTLATLEARLAVIEALMAESHGQMLASSQLIRELAEQNAQLIQRIETHRVRVLWLGSAISVTAIAVLVALYLAFSR